MRNSLAFLKDAPQAQHSYLTLKALSAHSSSAMTGTEKRPEPNGFSSEKAILRSRQHLKTFAVNQMTSNAGAVFEVVLAFDHGVQGVARCTYHTSPARKAVRIAA